VPIVLREMRILRSKGTEQSHHKTPDLRFIAAYESNRRRNWAAGEREALIASLPTRLAEAIFASRGVRFRCPDALRTATLFVVAELRLTPAAQTLSDTFAEVARNFMK
ncbi:MAG TPA: hypothetical protein VKA77_01785, partial [Mycobacterium sp.]|nr:hypothetical protein [Mycobacterium sp.]